MYFLDLDSLFSSLPSPPLSENEIFYIGRVRSSACHGTGIKSYRNINRLSQILPAKFREKGDCSDSNRRNLDEKKHAHDGSENCG